MSMSSLAMQQQGMNSMLRSGLSGSLLMSGSNAPIERANLETFVLSIGEYSVMRESSRYRMYVRTDGGTVIWLAEWPSVPSRSVVAATIRAHRNQRPRVNARDEFGSLLGVRYFGLAPDFGLISPVQGTRWETNVLSAASWDDSEAVRGVCGIHACWPTRTARARPIVDCVAPDPIYADVRGMGRFVVGSMGWRAEKVIIDTVYLQSNIWSRWRIVKRLERLYPQIAFEEESWTLEKSLKSGARSRVNSR